MAIFKCKCCGKEVEQKDYNGSVYDSVMKTSMLFIMTSEGRSIRICKECYKNKVLPVAKRLEELLGGSGNIGLQFILSPEKQQLKELEKGE